MKLNEQTANLALQLLEQVDAGQITAYHVGPDWNSVYCGNVEFSISGMRIVIFNDCDEFDYVDSVTTEDGKIRLDYKDLQGTVLDEYNEPKTNWYEKTSPLVGESR